jgi:hypothetical protein
MRWNAEPERLADRACSPEDLRLAIRTARASGPSAAELTLLAARLDVAPAARSPKRPRRRPAMRSGSVAKSLTLLTIAACGLLAVLRSRTREPAIVADRPAPALPSASEDTSVSDRAALETAPTHPETATPVPSVAIEPTPRASAGHAVLVAPGRERKRPTALRSEASSNDTDSSYETEAHLLAEARGKLKGDPSRALELAEEHQRRFATGQLVEEREVIAMTALVRLGRIAEASSRWETFRARFAESAYAPRLSSLFAPFATSTEKSQAAPPLTP